MEATTLNEAPVDQKKKLFTPEDVFEAIKRQGREMPLEKEYDAKFFWDSLGEKYYKKFQKPEQFKVNIPWIIDRLKVLKLKTLLEVGSGFGRTLPFLLDSGAVDEVTGIDISEEVIKSSQEYLKPSDRVLTDEEIAKGKKPSDYREKIKLLVGDARKLDFESESFDVVLSNEMLQHVSPDEIEGVLMEMLRVSRKAVVCVERWAFPSEHAEPHIWSHNLGDYFKKLGVKIAQISSVNNSMQGVVVLKRG